MMMQVEVEFKLPLLPIEALVLLNSSVEHASCSIFDDEDED